MEGIKSPTERADRGPSRGAIGARRRRRRGSVVDERPHGRGWRIRSRPEECSRPRMPHIESFSDASHSFHGLHGGAAAGSAVRFRAVQEFFPSPHAEALTALPKSLSLPLRTRERTRANESGRSLTSCLNSVQNVSRARRFKRVSSLVSQAQTSRSSLNPGVATMVERSVHRTEI